MLDSRRRMSLVSGLDLDGRHHAKRGVPRLSVVPYFEVFEDFIRQIDTFVPALGVRQL
ncbi:hypothetical protein [Candidatus Poriferisodalis sp.]|uniref:hypothetical protein n=1 Tax=Candidatus Poriferisodalis sp. TaxID=3101277 RepID=UPI003B523E59